MSITYNRHLAIGPVGTLQPHVDVILFCSILWFDDFHYKKDPLHRSQRVLLRVTPVNECRISDPIGHTSIQTFRPYSVCSIYSPSCLLGLPFSFSSLSALTLQQSLFPSFWRITVHLAVCADDTPVRCSRRQHPPPRWSSLTTIRALTVSARGATCTRRSRRPSTTTNTSISAAVPHLSVALVGPLQRRDVQHLQQSPLPRSRRLHVAL